MRIHAVSHQLVTIILLNCFGAFTTQVSAEFPEVRVSNVRKVFDNGEHNAFTDLCRFQNKLYLTFRSCPDGHMVHPTSSIIILTSDDGTDWKPVHRFHVPLRDTRDPHFLIFQNKLFVYTGTWYCGETSPETYDMNQHLGYAVWSENGRDWEGSQQLEGTYGHYIWKAATFGDNAYLCARRKRGFLDDNSRKRDRQATESAMLVSDDGLVWKWRSLFQEEWGDETAFLFEQDGSVLAVSRRSSNPAEICRSSRPYSQWKRTPLDRYIGGPLLTKWKDRYVVAGRENTGNGPRTSFYWLDKDQLVKFAELPSGGDNSYPGFVELDSERALVSWYSSHEKDSAGIPTTNIYLAEFELKKP